VKRARLKNAKVGAVDWSGKDMRGAQLQGCDLMGCLLRNTNLWYANFEGANLKEADLSGARFDAETCGKRGWLRGATVGAVDWSGKDLRGAQLQGTDLKGANMKNADLSGANLERANSAGVNFMNANLTHSKFHYANLCGVNFYRADLRNAELQTQEMDGNTYFGNAKVAGAIISSQGWQRAFAVGTLRADGVELVLFDGVKDKQAPPISTTASLSDAEQGPEVAVMADAPSEAAQGLFNEAQSVEELGANSSMMASPVHDGPLAPSFLSPPPMGASTPIALPVLPMQVEEESSIPCSTPDSGYVQAIRLEESPSGERPGIDLDTAVLQLGEEEPVAIVPQLDEGSPLSTESKVDDQDVFLNDVVLEEESPSSQLLNDVALEGVPTQALESPVAELAPDEKL